MEGTAEQFAARYASMSKLELMDLAQQYNTLVEPAQAALRAEFTKRQLEPPIVNEPVDFDMRGLVTVERFRDLPEAIVARSRLEAEGIEAWVQDENLVRIDWGYSNAIGGMRLQVNAHDGPAAIEVLKQKPTNIPFADGLEYIQPQCSKCGSSDLELLPMMTNIWVCGACGARGTIVEENEDEGKV